jgi:hypothetical protein
LFIELDDALARAQFIGDELARRYGADPMSYLSPDEARRIIDEELALASAPLSAPQGACNPAPRPTGETQMPKVTDMLSSKYLRKEDVDDELIVTCKTVLHEDMPGDGNEQRWILYFKEFPKGLVLNTTSIRVLEKAFGGHTDDWAGKKVAMYVDPNVTYKGQVTGGLRLRPLKPPKPSSAGRDPPSAAPAATAFEFDDKIP